MKLSAIIPTLNEEENIREAILSVSFADEILVIDSLSTDNTVQIAGKAGAKVVQYRFDNFSAQKNRAIDLVQNEWIILLDADERISPELQNEIIQIFKSKPVHDAYWFYRKNYFLGKEVNYSGWQNDKVIRLIKKDTCRYNNKPVHEEIETSGTTGLLKNKLIHFTYKSKNDYLKKLNHYALLQAHELKMNGKKVTWFHLYLKPAFRFFRHFILKQGFRDRKTGFEIAKLQAYGVYLRYKKLKDIS
ncbi:MAG: glycosyltransferase family 2 protein [Prolixibacteraceae bacterium]|nr:glycosyltransferase family 2 protein [Prolixibacteraceae bacterium]